MGAHFVRAFAASAGRGEAIYFDVMRDVSLMCLAIWRVLDGFMQVQKNPHAAGWFIWCRLSYGRSVFRLQRARSGAGCRDSGGVKRRASVHMGVRGGLRCQLLHHVQRVQHQLHDVN